jgi:hypothetical protein
MNHFTPFLPVRRSLVEVITSDDSSRDLEQRWLDIMRMRTRTQRRAEAVLLVVTGFVFTFAYALQV